MGLEAMGSAILKGDAGAGDEIGHRPRHQDLARSRVFADGACAFVGAPCDAPLGRQIAFAGMKAEMA